MSVNRGLNTLGLAKRAGKIITGDELILQVSKKQVALVLLASDASARTKKQMHSKCEYYGVEVIEYFSKEEISDAVGMINRIAVGITDSGFSKLIKDKMKG